MKERKEKQKSENVKVQKCLAFVPAFMRESTMAFRSQFHTHSLQNCKIRPYIFLNDLDNAEVGENSNAN